VGGTQQKVSRVYIEKKKLGGGAQFQVSPSSQEGGKEYHKNGEGTGAQHFVREDLFPMGKPLQPSISVGGDEKERWRFE